MDNNEEMTDLEKMIRDMGGNRRATNQEINGITAIDEDSSGHSEATNRGQLQAIRRQLRNRRDIMYGREAGGACCTIY